MKKVPKALLYPLIIKQQKKDWQIRLTERKLSKVERMVSASSPER